MDSFILAASMDGSKVLDIGSAGFVSLLGVCVVFVGLICIVLICSLMSFIFKKTTGENTQPEQSAEPIAQTAPVSVVPEDKRGEFIAAVSAVIAEELGTDVDAIKITSVKKL